MPELALASMLKRLCFLVMEQPREKESIFRPTI
jgi:hypothetical protein